MSALAMPAITIGAATADDADAISALVSDLARRHIAPDCSPEGAARLLASMDPAATADRLRANHPTWIAIADGALIGVVVVRPPRHLYHLFVADAWRRQGLARRLWVRAREGMLDEGVEPITVNAARHAVAAYERLGFIREDAQRQHDGVPSIPMRWLAGREL